MRSDEKTAAACLHVRNMFLCDNQTVRTRCRNNETDSRWKIVGFRNLFWTLMYYVRAERYVEVQTTKK